MCVCVWYTKILVCFQVLFMFCHVGVILICLLILHVLFMLHGSLNVPIEHHPTIRYMVYNGYYKVMSFIFPKWDRQTNPFHVSSSSYVHARFILSATVSLPWAACTGPEKISSGSFGPSRFWSSSMTFTSGGHDHLVVDLPSGYVKIAIENGHW